MKEKPNWRFCASRVGLQEDQRSQSLYCAVIYAQFAQAVAIPHYAVIANVIQMSAYHKVNEDYTTWDKRRFRPGDVAAASMVNSLVHQ